MDGDDLWSKQTNATDLRWNSREFLLHSKIIFLKSLFSVQGYDVAGVAPDFVEGPVPRPCTVCPQGPAGWNGTDVSKILYSLTNFHELIVLLYVGTTRPKRRAWTYCEIWIFQ